VTPTATETAAGSPRAAASTRVQPIRVGTVALSTNLFLSPLAGYTMLPFRLIIRSMGGVGLCTTDLVNARSLIERNRKAYKLVETCDDDRPLAVQLYGTAPEEMRDAALLLEARGIDMIDINMGCPVKKVCRNGGGASMMADVRRAAHVVSTMTGALKIPVTCKMRLGWDDANLTAPELARALEDAGAAAIIVHGRTRQQGFGGTVNLAGIRAVVRALRSIPCVGNGDITTPESARVMFAETGCAAISIGRGAFYNPWIFQHITRYLDDGTILPEPTFEERIDIVRRHLDLMIEVFGEEEGCRKFRKVGLQYSRRFGPCVEFDKRIVRINTRAEFDEVLIAYREWRQKFCGPDGELLPQYAPRPMADLIPVPRGPNELW
jgi:nifR3 family TIM-barrel protein